MEYRCYQRVNALSASAKERRLETEAADLKRQIMTGEAVRKLLNQEIGKLHEDLRLSRAANAMLTKDIKNKNLVTSLDQARAEVKDLRGKLHDVETRRRGHKAAADRFHQQIEDEHAARESLQQQVSSARTGVYAAKTSSRELSVRLTNARTQLGVAANVARTLYAALHKIADSGAPCSQGHRIDADRVILRVGSPETWGFSEAQPGVPLPTPSGGSPAPVASSATPPTPDPVRAAVDRLDAAWRSASLRTIKDEIDARSRRRLSFAFKAVELSREWEIVDGRAVLLPPGLRPLQQSAESGNTALLTSDDLSMQLTAESRLRAGATPSLIQKVAIRRTDVADGAWRRPLPEDGKIANFSDQDVRAGASLAALGVAMEGFGAGRIVYHRADDPPAAGAKVSLTQIAEVADKSQSAYPRIQDGRRDAFGLRYKDLYPHNSPGLACENCGLSAGSHRFISGRYYCTPGVMSAEERRVAETSAPSDETRHTVPTPPADRKRFQSKCYSGSGTFDDRLHSWNSCAFCDRAAREHDLISGVYYCCDEVKP